MSTETCPSLVCLSCGKHYPGKTSKSGTAYAATLSAAWTEGWNWFRHLNSDINDHYCPTCWEPYGIPAMDESHKERGLIPPKSKASRRG